MSIGSVCMVIGLVSSSAMSYSNRLFTESDALTWSLFPISPLITGSTEYALLYTGIVCSLYRVRTVKCNSRADHGRFDVTGSAYLLLLYAQRCTTTYALAFTAVLPRTSIQQYKYKAYDCAHAWKLESGIV